jgi:cell division control protein 6
MTPGSSYAGSIPFRSKKASKITVEATLSTRRLSDFLKQLELLDLIDADYHYGGREGKTREIEIKDFMVN